MANKIYTEPVTICFQPVIGDGAGGFTPSGPEIVVEEVVVPVEEKSANRTDSFGKLVFQNVYTITKWINPAYELSNKHYLRWRGKKLIIQDVKSNDKLTKNILTCTADGN